MLNNYILISNGIFISEDELYHWGYQRYEMGSSKDSKT